MKKLIIVLLTLFVLATTSFAGERVDLDSEAGIAWMVCMENGSHDFIKILFKLQFGEDLENHILLYDGAEYYFINNSELDEDEIKDFFNNLDLYDM